jgi:hypothetical protein
LTRPRSRLDETRLRIIAERDEKLRAWQMLQIEIAALDRALELRAEPPAAADKKRAKPGSVEAAIMHRLHDRTMTADALVAGLHFEGVNPESVRGALRRMLAAGKITKDGDSYAIPPAAEAAQ